MKIKIEKLRGFTLIELLVALAISSFIVIIVIGIITLALKRSHGGFESYEAQEEAQSTMNRMAKEIRQATRVIDAQPQTITFREYVNADDATPSQVRFYLDGATLKRGEIPPTGTEPDYTYNPADETTKILSLRVINGAGEIFSYFNQNGTELAAPVTLAAVTLVSINLTFDQPSSPNPFRVGTKVQLRFNKANL